MILVLGSEKLAIYLVSTSGLQTNIMGVLTGKPTLLGGSSLRVEATGYGIAYFLSAMLDAKGDSLRGKRCLVSGAGKCCAVFDGKAVTNSMLIILELQ